MEGTLEVLERVRYFADDVVNVKKSYVPADFIL